MQGLRLLHATPQDWFGRPLSEVPDADLWRWLAVRNAASRLIA